MDRYPGVRLMYGGDYNLWHFQKGQEYFVVVEEYNAHHIWWVFYHFELDVWNILLEFRSVGGEVQTIFSVHAEIVNYSSALNVGEPLLLVVDMSDEGWWWLFYRIEYARFVLMYTLAACESDLKVSCSEILDHL
jgi:hypothetical protein